MSVTRTHPRKRARRRRVGAALAAAVVVGVYATTWIPYPVDALRKGLTESHRLYDRHGRLLREVVNEHGARAKWVDQVADNVKAATLAAEDRRFYKHHGVDGRAILRAAWQNLRAQRVVSGASTITMQMARMHGGYAQRSVLGKLRQAFDAWRVERALSKEEILIQYVNRASYGAGTIGVEAASQRYFGKPHHHLSVAEAALLAGLPKAPTTLNPLRDPGRARARQRYVLDQMLKAGALEKAKHAQALAEPLRFVSHPPELQAGHFTDYVLRRRTPRRELHTTLDLDMQGPIERLTASHVDALERGGLTNAAVVVLDNATCDVLAMSGSTGYWDEAGGSVNGALALRQPGSTLKPFLFAMAFEQGYEPTSALSDIPTVYPGGDGALQRPRNYSERFTGPVLAKDALGRSLNVPSIRLANALGIEHVLARLQSLGLSSLEHTPEHYGLGLVLGNGEVRLLELTRAYAALARGGVTCELRALRDDAQVEGERIFSEAATFLVTEALSDASLRVRAFGVNNPLLFDYPVAVKTGTSSNWRDSWAVGYTDRYTVGIWSGDFSGRPMHELSGSVGAGPLFRRVVEFLVERGAISVRPRPVTPPAGVERVQVCSLSGMRAGEHCPHQREMWTSNGGGDRAECPWHRSIPIDVRNGLRASAKCPSEFVEPRTFDFLPPRFAAWQGSHPHATRAPPLAYSPLCPQSGTAVDAVVITHPKPTDVFVIEPGYRRRTQTVSFEAEVDPPVPSVTWFVDGERYAAAHWPYELAWPLEPGRHRLQVLAGDRRSEPIEIEVR